jgi:hypothetical protein
LKIEKEPHMAALKVHWLGVPQARNTISPPFSSSTSARQTGSFFQLFPFDNDFKYLVDQTLAGAKQQGVTLVPDIFT